MTPEDGPGFPRRRRALEVAALLAMAAIVGYQTIVPPPVGLADNGDFARLAGPMGLRSTIRDPAARYFAYLLPGFRLGAPWWESRYGTSESIPIVLARAAGGLLSKSGFVDVRVFGAVNGLFALAGVALLLAASRPWRLSARILFAVLVVAMYGDVGYAAPMNSLFSQTASLWTFLFLAAFTLLAIDRPTPVALWGYWIAALLFVTAKPQEVVQAPVLAVLGGGLTARGGGAASRRWRPWAIGAGLCLAAGIYFLRIPPTISGPGMHNEVFVEILGQSPDPAADLRELGLPAGWAEYRGLNPHDPKSPYADPAFRTELFRRVGPERLIAFWARHPRRAAALVRRCLHGALRMRPPELGNFRQIDGMPPGAQSAAFSVWSGIKNRGASRSLRWIAAVLLAGALAGIRLAGRRDPAMRGRGAALIVLVAMASVELIVPVFAQGAWGIERVLFGFHAMFDFCVIALVLLAAGLFAPAAAARAAALPAGPPP